MARREYDSQGRVRDLDSVGKKAQFGLSEPQGFDGFDLFTSEDWDEQSLAIQAAEKAGIESGTSFWCGFRYI